MPECPVCNTQTEESAYIETYTSFFNNQEYKLYHCKNKDCDLQWWEPLKIIPEFYEQEGDEAYAVFHLGIREELGENHKMFFKHIPVKSGRLLDVGCGDGVFLMHAQKAGFEVWGVDFDSKSIKACQQKRGLKNTFVASPWEFAEYCEKNNIKFHVITFFEVLEHQDDPVGFLEAIKKMLKPGGWIAGSVPNRESWLQGKMFREINHQVDNPPHHFLRFNMHSLENILKSQGFTDIFVSATPLKIKEVVPYIQVILTGDTINKRLRRGITGSENIGEGTSLFRDLPLWKKIIFKSLKSARFALLFVPALWIKMNTQGIHLYFNGILSCKTEIDLT